MKIKNFHLQSLIFNWAVLSFLLCLSSISKAVDPKLQRYEYAQMQMGVRVRIVLYAHDKTAAREAAGAAFDEIARLNDILSHYVPTSELMRLCEKAGGPPVPVSKDLFFVLQRALAFSSISNGAFDITVGPYTKLWREARKEGRLPSEKELARVDSLVGWQNVRLDPVERTVQLEVPGMQLDLGGIAKGYALDRALVVLRRHGIERALVEAGGDVAVSGPPPGREGWKIAIENADPAGKTLILSYAAVASSGDTEQFVEINGTRYSHIVDPRTGIGLTNRIAVTVVAPDGLTADGFATAISVLGYEEGRKFARSFPGIRAFIRRAK